MKKKKFGIRGRLITVMILLTVIPLVVTGYFLAKINEQSIKEQVMEQQLALTSQVEEITHTIVKETSSQLAEIELLLNDRKLSLDATLRLVGYKISTSRRIDFVNIYDKDGAYVDSFVLEGRQRPFFSPDILDHTIMQKVQAERWGKGKIIDHKGRLFLPIGVLWKLEGRVHGYIWTAVDITPLSKKLNAIIHDHFVTTVHSAYLVDEDFDVVVHSQWEQVPAQRNVKETPFFRKTFTESRLPKGGIGASSEYTDDRGDWLVGLNTIYPYNWLVVVMQKRSAAYRTLISMRKNILVVGSIFLFAAVLLGAVLGGGMTRPILAVARGARQLASQKFSHRIKVKAKDEIGEMAHAFNSLGQSLEEYDARIKKEVAIRSDLSRYLTPELVEAVIQRKADLHLGGKRQHVTVLYADVVGFTTLSELHPPEVVVTLLNELFTILTQIIFRNKGMIDKFIGDCVMALFGAPEPAPDAAVHAVKAAQEMNRWLEVGNKKWSKEYNLTIQLAIAIHCGEVIIGNIGSEKRMEFTAIGDVVNTASRLEKIAEGDQILITGSVKDKLQKTGNVKPFGRFALRGKNREIDVFEVHS